MAGDERLGDASTTTEGRYGDTIRVPNYEGSITVSEPGPFVPSAEATMSRQWSYFSVVTITETNDGADDVPLGWALRPAGDDARYETIGDPDLGITAIDGPGTSPTRWLASGGSTTYRVVFGTDEPVEAIVASPLANFDFAVFR